MGKAPEVDIDIKRIDERGRLTIPHDWLLKLGVTPGQRVVIQLNGEGTVMTVMNVRDYGY